MTECVDRWNPDTCSLAAMQAYKLLELEGQIIIDRVEVGRKTERVTVYYRAKKTHQEALQLLKAAKARLEGMIA
jgi:ribosome-binding factor A